MKNFIVIVLAFFIAIFNQTAVVKVSKADMPYTVVAYDGEVRHFFTHELVYSPQKAFDKKNDLRYCFDKDHLLTTEYVNFLEKMRIHNYVLVDFDLLYEVRGNKVIKKPLYLPLNKKPFTISLDDMSYDTDNRGIINKLIVDENGELRDYSSNESEKVTTGRESITILEEYLKVHPDFSIKNSKMCICVNGYNGILGYRIQNGSPNRESETEELKKVVAVLKEKGYTFACHSYSHSFVPNCSPNFVSKDLYKWQTEIESVIGKTDIYCFPGGLHNARSYNDKIIQDRYKILLCVGLDMHSVYEQSENYVYLYRTALDGNSLRTYPNMYREIFEPNEIYDNKSRFIKYFKI